MDDVGLTFQRMGQKVVLVGWFESEGDEQGVVLVEDRFETMC
jgi:hypothetical protein